METLDLKTMAAKYLAALIAAGKMIRFAEEFDIIITCLDVVIDDEFCEVMNTELLKDKTDIRVEISMKL